MKSDFLFIEYLFMNQYILESIEMKILKHIIIYLCLLFIVFFIVLFILEYQRIICTNGLWICALINGLKINYYYGILHLFIQGIRND